MAGSLASLQESVLIVVDLQPSFLGAIVDSQRVLARCEFLIRVAGTLGVPIIATEQVPERMGHTGEPIAQRLADFGVQIYGKSSFSCIGCLPFETDLAALGRRQAVLVGIETHICVCQTALHLLQAGMDVHVCGDAVRSRGVESHELGISRLRHAGAVVTHTESVAYEWMKTSEHPQFREALKIVKEYSIS